MQQLWTKTQNCSRREVIVVIASLWRQYRAIKSSNRKRGVIMKLEFIDNLIVAIPENNSDLQFLVKRIGGKEKVERKIGSSPKHYYTKEQKSLIYHSLAKLSRDEKTTKIAELAKELGVTTSAVLYQYYAFIRENRKSLTQM